MKTKQALTLLSIVIIILSSCVPKDEYFYLNKKKVRFNKYENLFALQLANSAMVDSVKQYLRTSFKDKLNYASQPAFDFSKFGVAIIQSNDEIIFNNFLSSLDKPTTIHPTIINLPETNKVAIVINRVSAKFKESVTLEQMSAYLIKHNFKNEKEIAETSQFLRNVYLNPNTMDVFEASNKIYESGLVEYAHPDLMMKPELRSSSDEAPNYDLQNQWHHEQIKTQAAWTHSMGSPEVKIGILDDGFFHSHEELSPNYLDGRNLQSTTNGRNPSPAISEDGLAETHGTKVASLAVGKGIHGIYGTCPNCKFIGIKYTSTVHDISSTIRDFLVDRHNVSVISISWDYGFYTDDFTDAVEAASKYGRNGKGVPIFFAIGNSNSHDPCSEWGLANNKYIISIGASDSDDEVLDISSGPCLDLIAPGEAIVSADYVGRDANGDLITDCVGFISQSSAATPLVAGLAGILISKEPELSRDAIQGMLQLATDTIAGVAYGYDCFNEEAGFGRINAKKIFSDNVGIYLSSDQINLGQNFDLTIKASSFEGVKRFKWSYNGCTHDNNDEWIENDLQNEENSKHYFEKTFSNLKFDSGNTLDISVIMENLNYPNSGSVSNQLSINFNQNLSSFSN